MYNATNFSRLSCTYYILSARYKFTLRFCHFLLLLGIFSSFTRQFVRLRIYLFICLSVNVYACVCVCVLSGKVKSPFIKFNLSKTYIFVNSLCLSPPHRINVTFVALFSAVVVVAIPLIFTYQKQR